KWPIAQLPLPNNSEYLFAEFCLTSGLHQLITTPTRFRTGQLPSLLDLLLINDKQLVSDLKLSAPIGKSDHAVIAFNVQTINCNNPKYILKPIKKIDYDALQYAFSSTDWSDLYHINDSVNLAWDLFFKR